MGVWIETTMKQRLFNFTIVTPFVGVWIETLQKSQENVNKSVTPFVGVWIETLYLLQRYEFSPSHPSWVCGLKLEHY